MFKNIGLKKAKLDKINLSKDVLKNLKAYFDIEWTYNSNAIEGNTLTLTETKMVIEEGITVGKGKKLSDHLEVINHKEAIDYVEDLVKRKITISEGAIKYINYILLKNIDSNNAGIYRNANVLISGSRHKPPINIIVPEMMKELIEWYKENKEKLHPVELAAIFHYKLTYIHPFTDGNGRTGRLMMNLILMQYGYPPAIIRIEDRTEYMECLEKASVENSLESFIKLIASEVEKSLDTYLYLAN